MSSSQPENGVVKIKRGATTTGVVLGVASRTTTYIYEWEYGDMVTSELGESAMYIARGNGAFHHVIFIEVYSGQLSKPIMGTIPDHLIRPLPERLP